MPSPITAVVLLLLALAGVVVRKTYYYLPAHELKRRAEHHDQVAARLYRAVAYGNSLRSLLWLYIGLTSAAALVLIARLLPVWASLLIVGPLLWICFSLLPSTRVTRLGVWLTSLVTPLIVGLLNYLHSVLSLGADRVERRYTMADHTGLFERDDLLELIEQQQHQQDSRLSDEEIEIVRRALAFSDYKVADILIPRKKVKTLLASNVIGPVLIDELHKNKQPCALVRDKPRGEIVGTLMFAQLGLHTKGTVQNVMEPAVYYLHEDDSLTEALHAFFTTNQALFVVVNSFQEYVGVVTIEDMVKQLLGHIPGDDFDQYTDISAVAARHSKAKTAKEAEGSEEQPQQTPVKTEKEMVE